MLIRGNSGAKIELSGGTLIKSDVDEFGCRLERQIRKQSEFQQTETIRAPRILSTKRFGDTFLAEMEFVRAKNFIQFLTLADRKQLIWFADTICQFISLNVSGHLEDAAGRVFDKLAELYSKGVSGELITKTAWLVGDGEVNIPIGYYHGDLTLSNILFAKNKIYLIDFLDCFVESPLLDICKLRQDTCSGWSLLLYAAAYDKNKISIALDFLDNVIKEEFSTRNWYQHYNLFQAINWLRVIPYCKETKTRNFCEEQVRKLIH